MLKRFQVLLPDWLEENIKVLADKYDLSTSEIIRAEVCFATLSALVFLDPKYKPGITPEEILNKFKNQNQGTLERDEMHRTLSKIYFETRKAIEYWQNKNKS